MTSLKETRVPKMSTRVTPVNDTDGLELDSDSAVATLERPATEITAPAGAKGASTPHAGLFSVDVLAGWFKP